MDGSALQTCLTSISLLVCVMCAGFMLRCGLDFFDDCFIVGPRSRLDCRRVTVCCVTDLLDQCFMVGPCGALACRLLFDCCVTDLLDQSFMVGPCVALGCRLLWSGMAGRLDELSSSGCVEFSRGSNYYFDLKNRFHVESGFDKRVLLF